MFEKNRNELNQLNLASFEIFLQGDSPSLGTIILLAVQPDLKASKTTRLRNRTGTQCATFAMQKNVAIRNHRIDHTYSLSY